MALTLRQFLLSSRVAFVIALVSVMSLASCSSYNPPRVPDGRYSESINNNRFRAEFLNELLQREKALTKQSLPLVNGQEFEINSTVYRTYSK